MAHEISAVISGPSYNEAILQIQNSNLLADLLEFRLDLLTNLTLDELQKLKWETYKPLILTIRNHLVFTTTICNIITVLEPSYLDFEWDGPQHLISQFQKQFPQIKTICSYHDFDLPEKSHNLSALYSSMRRISANYYKIAIRANSTLESLKMLSFLKEHNQEGNLIGLCMGEAGQITRILGPIFGNAITYAAPTEESIIAPGQLDLKTLVHTYHHKNINRETKLFGLVGNPVSYSVSHLSHNEALRKLQFNAIYVKMNLLADEFAECLDLLVNLGWSGLSVTMPFKETVLKSVSVDGHLSAINTLKIENRAVSGFNTDRSGAMRALLKVTELKDKHVVLLGAGGVAKAIAEQLVIEGAILTILNRTVSKAQELALAVGGKFVSFSAFGEVAKAGYDILINCTSIGQIVGECSIDENDLLSSRVVMEVLSSPRETPLVKAALMKQCQIVYGIDMFVYQAVDQFAIWFGENVRKEVENCLIAHVR